MRRRLLAVLTVGLLAGACTPAETYWWDGYHRQPLGTTARALCKADPQGYLGLCPFPPAADVTVCSSEPELCITHDEYDEEWPHGTPSDWEKETTGG